ncbi:MAG TPA: hypothetical protein PLZ08_03100 [Bacillota bacterium]|jgi:hypothetical protein|nr:hypothetical protein [Bacillota bacterium]HOL09264.1 hypothetical protein [Bacillota bacterium]HPO96927.1 hypothetical protein [Bacillota bacterium]
MIIMLHMLMFIVLPRDLPVNPHGTDEEWQKGDEIPELDCQIRAIIKRIKEGNRSRFILIDYLKQE